MAADQPSTGPPPTPVASTWRSSSGKWGVVRYPWVTSKLALVVSVILVGSLVLGPGVDALRDGDSGAETRVLAGAAWDVVALLTATALSVYKPGGARATSGMVV